MSLSPALSGSSLFNFRCLSLFPNAKPFLIKFKAYPKSSTMPPSFPFFVIRSCSSSITAKSSSELRKIPFNTVPDEKLRSLRGLFSKPGIGIDAYIVPSHDAHQSEFIDECYLRMACISGFTGSSGTAVITKDRAALWTDGRYFLQAEKQLGSSWILMQSGNSGVPTTSEWLNEVLSPGGRIGIDPFLFSYDVAEKLKEDISRKNHELVYLYHSNLVDEIWGTLKPKSLNKPIRVHNLKYAGVDVSTKLLSLRSELNDANCRAIVLSMLDEIAWLLNLRGNDIPHSPVMYAYLIVEIGRAMLFVDSSKVTSEVVDHLKNAGIELKPYVSILSTVESLALQGVRVWLDPSSLNAAIVNTYNSARDIYSKNLGENKITRTKMYDNSDVQSCPTGYYKVSPVLLAKAVKNHAELEGMYRSHLRDAAALSKFWAWLEEEIYNGKALTEVEVADKLYEFRAMQDGFMDSSFDTISGSGANGAIIHYKPKPSDCSFVDANQLFLLDSGAQYIDGTTDITRTVHFSQPTSREKECFTRVLQGHIALDEAVFPENTPGFVLDVFARSYLWKMGLDYRHGTGHGVGAALNVHEGPQSISSRFENMTPLQKGMVVSNEPGYYEDHAFGIRIENLVFVKEVDTPNRFLGRRYLGFEKLTYVPIQSKLIDTSLLCVGEINWVDEYHSQVWEKVSPLLVDDASAAARQWLWSNTRPLLLKP